MLSKATAFSHFLDRNPSIYFFFVYENSPESRQHSLPSLQNSKHNFSPFEKVYVRRAPVSSAMRLAYRNTFYFLIFCVLRHRHLHDSIDNTAECIEFNRWKIFFLFLLSRSPIRNELKNIGRIQNHVLASLFCLQFPCTSAMCIRIVVCAN